MITLADELRTQIRIHCDGIPAHTLIALLMSSNHGPWGHADIIAEMANARADGFANVEADGRWHQTAFSIAKERYELTRLIEPTWRDRASVILTNLWHKCWGGLVLIVATTFFALGLCAQEGEWRLCEVTAYCGGPCLLCETTGVTANGTQTNSVPYGVAASPNLPLGSRVWIPVGAGYLDQSRATNRWMPVDDRGGALRSEWHRSGITRLDLRFRTHASAKAFGRKLISVFVAN